MENAKVWMMRMMAVLAIQAPFIIHAANESADAHAARRAAFQECAASTGFTPPQHGGVRPDQMTDEERQAMDALRAKMDACLVAKGITPPQPGDHHHHGPPPAESSNSTSAE